MEPLFVAERQKRILELVRERGKVEVKELTSVLGVSEPTIRRDLLELENAGGLLRAHGGAVSKEQLGSDLPYLTKAGQNVAAKQRIAQAACGLIHEGDSIILDAGSTNLEIARQLHGMKGLTVVTHDLNVALELVDEPGIIVYLAGGQVQRLVYSTVGIQTVEYYRACHVQRAFLGADALDVENGVTARSADRAAVKSAITRSADEIIVVADHSKLGKRQLFRAFPTSAFQRLITSKEAPTAELDGLLAAGVKVEVT